MKAFIDREREKIQSLFVLFNERGSWIELRESGGEPIRLGLVDSYRVTRVAPQFDTSGELKHIVFWLFYKAAGYDSGFQYVHTLKIVRWSQEDGYLIDLYDDRKRHFHVELIMPETEPGMVADWKRWCRYKGKNRPRFEKIDAQLLEEHLEIAESWE